MSANSLIIDQGTVHGHRLDAGEMTYVFGVIIQTASDGFDILTMKIGSPRLKPPLISIR